MHKNLANRQEISVKSSIMYILESTDELGRRLVFPLVKARTVLGRDPSCDIVLNDEDVSRHHAKIYLMEGRLQIKDMESRNGTFVNNERIDKMFVLRPGSELIIGSNQFFVRVEDTNEEEVSHTTMLTAAQLRKIQEQFIPEKFDDEKAVEPIPVEDDGEGFSEEVSTTIAVERKDLLKAIYQKKIDFAAFPSLEIIYGANKGNKFILQNGMKYILGRQDGVNIKVEDPKVSSKHGSLERVADGWLFIDLGSTNGSILNAKICKKAVLKHGDTLVLGNTKLKFIDRSSAKAQTTVSVEEQLEETAAPPKPDQLQSWFEKNKKTAFIILGAMGFVLLVLVVFLAVW